MALHGNHVHPSEPISASVTLPMGKGLRRGPRVTLNQLVSGMQQGRGFRVVPVPECLLVSVRGRATRGLTTPGEDAALRSRSRHSSLTMAACPVRAVPVPSC
jgi:hypothetical protein